MTMDDSDACIIRGGGKRTGGVSTSTTSAAAAATANQMGSSPTNHTSRGLLGVEMTVQHKYMYMEIPRMK